METGKRICQALKNLRKRIADANEIPFEIEECTHKGDCPGTCPKCESELRYLMESINQPHTLVDRSYSFNYILKQVKLK